MREKSFFQIIPIGKTNAEAEEMWSIIAKSISGLASILSVKRVIICSSDSIGIGISTSTISAPHRVLFEINCSREL